MSELDLSALRLVLAQRTPGEWTRGGPYPGTSVIVCVDGGGGCWPPEPPTYEPIAILDQRTEGEPNPQDVANANAIVAAVNACEGLIERVERLEADHVIRTGRAEKVEAECKRLRERITELESGNEPKK